MRFGHLQVFVVRWRIILIVLGFLFKLYFCITQNYSAHSLRYKLNISKNKNFSE